MMRITSSLTNRIFLASTLLAVLALGFAMYFVNVRVPLPATLAPGEYRLRLTLDDLVSGRSASRELPLNVAP